MIDFAVIVPMANEEKEFQPFVDALSHSLDYLECGKVFIVVDTVSKDKTLELCNDLSALDPRFITVWAPDNKNIVDAYIRGYKEAINAGAEIIIEMDAGLSHDPRAFQCFCEFLMKEMNVPLAVVLLMVGQYMIQIGNALFFPAWEQCSQMSF